MVSRGFGVMEALVFRRGAIANAPNANLLDATLDIGRLGHDEVGIQEQPPGLIARTTDFRTASFSSASRW
jgi:hypothetical protein